MNNAKQKFEEFRKAFITALLENKVNKAQQKYEATHQLLGTFYGSDAKGRPHTNKKGEVVQLNHVKFVGWDYGKKYTVQKLQQMAQAPKAA